MPTSFDQYGNPDDLFGSLKYTVRSAQRTPDLETRWDECDPTYSFGESDYPTPAEIIDQTVPGWFVGLGVQLALAVVLLWWAWARTRTPARQLPLGTRIA